MAGIGTLRIRSRTPRFESADSAGAFLSHRRIIRVICRVKGIKNLPLCQCEGRDRYVFPSPARAGSAGDYESVCIFWLPDRPILRTFPEQGSSGEIADFVPGCSCGAATASHRLPQKDSSVVVRLFSGRTVAHHAETCQGNSVHKFPLFSTLPEHGQ